MQAAELPRPVGPRRTALVQRRARLTRQVLVDATLRLWGERGFARLDDITVEDISRLAGVSKTTFYFHFPRKEAVFEELMWATASALREEAVRGVAARRSGTALVRQLLGLLTKRTMALPPAAVRPALTDSYSPGAAARGSVRQDIRRSLTIALEAARDQGEIAAGTDVDEAAVVLAVLAIDALRRWASGDRRRLNAVVQRRAAIILTALAQPQARR